MVVITEYRTKPGKRDELFEAFKRLLAHPRALGQDLIVWSHSATQHDASFMFEYWSEAEDFADLATTEWYVDYLVAVDELVKSPPVTTVTIPQFVEGV